MPPRGRTPNNPPRRRPRVAGGGRPSARPGQDGTAEPASVAEQWADDPVEPAHPDPLADTRPEPTHTREPAPATAASGPDAVERGPAAAATGLRAPATAATEPATADTEPATAATEPAPATAATEPATEREPVVERDVERPRPRTASGSAPATSAERRRPSPKPTGSGATTAARPPRRPQPAAAGPAETVTATAGTRERGVLAGVPLLVVLALVAVVCAGAAALFRGQAARAGDDSGAGNLAVVDTAATSEVVGQVSKAIEIVLSYDHTSLDANEAAGREVVTGRYADEFGRTFADVRQTAPEQKLVLTTTVLLAGVTLIEGDRAEVIATMDLAAVRDTTPYNSPGRVKVVANRVDGRWKIAEMTLL